MEERCPTRLLADTPAETDAFGGHEQVARSIAEVVLTESGGKAIGLEGGWGAGNHYRQAHFSGASADERARPQGGCLRYVVPPRRSAPTHLPREPHHPRPKALVGSRKRSGTATSLSLQDVAGGYNQSSATIDRRRCHVRLYSVGHPCRVRCNLRWC